MPKKSAVKTAKPVLLKAPRIRLNKDMKETLLPHMQREFDARIDDTGLSETFTALTTRTNSILRVKYPEFDMAVLRKYDMTRVDWRLKFTVIGVERVFGVQLSAPGNVTAEVAG